MKSKKITIQKKGDQNIFDELSDEWWNERGSFEALHSFNPLRIKFILNSIGNSVKSLKILDVENNWHLSFPGTTSLFARASAHWLLAVALLFLMF